MTATGFREGTLPFIRYPELWLAEFPVREAGFTPSCVGAKGYADGVKWCIKPFILSFGGTSWPPWDFYITQKASWQPSSYEITPLCLDLGGSFCCMLLSPEPYSLQLQDVSCKCLTRVSLRTLESPSEEGHGEHPWTLT